MIELCRRVELWPGRGRAKRLGSFGPWTIRPWRNWVRLVATWTAVGKSIRRGSSPRLLCSVDGTLLTLSISSVLDLQFFYSVAIGNFDTLLMFVTLFFVQTLWQLLRTTPLTVGFGFCWFRVWSCFRASHKFSNLPWFEALSPVFACIDPIPLTFWYCLPSNFLDFYKDNEFTTENWGYQTNHHRLGSSEGGLFFGPVHTSYPQGLTIPGSGYCWTPFKLASHGWGHRGESSECADYGTGGFRRHSQGSGRCFCPAGDDFRAGSGYGSTRRWSLHLLCERRWYLGNMRGPAARPRAQNRVGLRQLHAVLEPEHLFPLPKDGTARSDEDGG